MKTPQKYAREERQMRGYFTDFGFYGQVDGRYMLFASETEYYEWMAGDN